MAHIGDFQMPEIDPKAARRMVRVGGLIVGLLVFIAVLFALIQPYVDFLWFSEDVRQPQVFVKGYQTRGLLFVPAFFASWALLYFSLAKALKISLIYLEKPSSGGQLIVSNAIHFIQNRGLTLVRVASPIFAFFSGEAFSNEWLTFLAARHSHAFGKTDPMFHLDLSFFVFTLPWYRAIANYLFGLFFLVTLLTIGLYILLQSLAAIGKIELGRPQMRSHIAVLIGITALAFGSVLYLKTYQYGLVDGQQFTGAGYAASVAMNMQKVTAILVGLAALAALALCRVPRIIVWLGRTAAAVAVLGILGVVVVPELIQRVSVEPNKLRVEGPFANRAIEMTRYAFGLDSIEVRDMPVQQTPTREEIAKSQVTLENMRLWDPEIVRSSIEVLQGLKPYYSFNDVDIDRYMVDGKQKMVMLAPRDLRLDGLSDTARTWLNEKLQYTHGFGVVMTSVNSASPDGEPTFLIRDIPPVANHAPALTEPRIYFTDDRKITGSENAYVLVRSNQPEFDYPAQAGEKTNTWTGDGGISIGGFFRRLAISITLGDGNLLVSNNISAQTRLLLHRGVVDRCHKLFPFLKLDNDPYIVLLNGKIYWIQDAYTTTDQLPYSARVGDGYSQLNYIRNPVKIVIDAYSGDTKAYLIEPDEPIAATYAAIYPGLLRPVAELPAGLRDHFRYPEDMFQLQAAALTQYHVTDSTTFLNNNDAWSLPQQIGAGGQEASVPPYYVQMRLPQEEKDGFVLMLPFTPREKPNMSGWLAAHCDTDRYGELVLYNFSKGANVAGSEQMETTINSDPKVNAAKLQLRGGGQTDVLIGNLLVIPFGNSVMYAESLFPTSRTSNLQAMPRLKKVVLALNGRVEIGDTYSEALKNLFGDGEGAVVAPKTGGDNTQPAPEINPDTKTYLPGIRKALELMDQADAALKQGDWAKYGALQKEARAKLRELAK